MKLNSLFLHAFLAFGIYLSNVNTGRTHAKSLHRLTSFDDPDNHMHHHHSSTYPKRSATSSRGYNMDRGLGFKKKNKTTAKPKTPYPWDASQAQGKVQIVETELMKSYQVKDEEPFPDNFYDDYDFEFPKGMYLNPNFETKVKMVYAARMRKLKGNEDKAEGGDSREIS